MAMTTSEPFGSLVEEAKRIELEGVSGHSERILAATLFVGCAWTDSPDTGMSVMTTADQSREAARTAAVYLARRVWEAREKFGFGCETASLEEGVKRALEASESTVFLSDGGDDVTASTPGDLPIVLKHLVDLNAADTLAAGIHETEAVQRCLERGEGKRLKLQIGAGISTQYGSPLDAELEVVRLIQADSPMAIVRIGKVEAILASRPASFRDRSEYQACGIDPLNYKVVVVKQGYLMPDLVPIAPRHILLLTPGTSDMQIERLPYIRRRKPAYPFEKDTVFDPETAAGDLHSPA
jgi:microcystin degradation protein MlrC